MSHRMTGIAAVTARGGDPALVEFSGNRASALIRMGRGAFPRQFTAQNCIIAVCAPTAPKVPTPPQLHYCSLLPTRNSRSAALVAMQNQVGKNPVNDKMGLSLIAEVMGWNSEEEATREYAWLQLMSSVKYDGYSYFRAGIRFIETLATWIKQFDIADRPAAYALVKERLVYLSLLEVQCLIDNFIPEVVTPRLRDRVAEDLPGQPRQLYVPAEVRHRSDRGNELSDPDAGAGRHGLVRTSVARRGLGAGVHRR